MDARKKVVRTMAPDFEGLEQKIAQRSDGKQREAMIKDLPFVLAARATDSRIVSLDEEARRLFATVSEHVGQIKEILWVNPSRPEEKPREWLEQDAPAKKERRIGHVPA